MRIVVNRNLCFFLVLVISGISFLSCNKDTKKQGASAEVTGPEDLPKALPSDGGGLTVDVGGSVLGEISSLNVKDKTSSSLILEWNYTGSAGTGFKVCRAVGQYLEVGCQAGDCRETTQREISYFNLSDNTNYSFRVCVKNSKYISTGMTKDVMIADDVSRQDKCKSTEYKKRRIFQRVHFNSNNKECNWNTGGNVAKQADRIRARYESPIHVLEEINASNICSLEITASENKFTYSDAIVFTINNVIYAASFQATRINELFNQILTSEQTPLYLYNWEVLLNKSENKGFTSYLHYYNFSTLLYYLDYNEGVDFDNRENRFSIPAWNIDTDGLYFTMNINFEEDIIQAVIDNNTKTDNIGLGIVVIGDQNNYDCKVDDVELTVLAEILEE